MSLEIKVYLVRDIEGFVLRFNSALILLKSSILFLGGKNTLYGYSQSNYHPIHRADIHRSYLVYFQVCNMLSVTKIV